MSEPTKVETQTAAYANIKRDSRRRVYLFVGLVTVLILGYFTVMGVIGYRGLSQAHEAVEVARDNAEEARALSKAICEELLVHHRTRNELHHESGLDNQVMHVELTIQVLEALGVEPKYDRSDLRMPPPTNIVPPSLCKEASD